MTGRRRATAHQPREAERADAVKYGWGCIGRFNRLLAQAGQEIGEYDVRDEEIMQLLGRMNVIDLAAEYFYAVHILDRFEWALDSAVRERD